MLSLYCLRKIRVLCRSIHLPPNSSSSRFEFWVLNSGIEERFSLRAYPVSLGFPNIHVCGVSPCLMYHWTVVLKRVCLEEMLLVLMKCNNTWVSSFIHEMSMQQYFDLNGVKFIDEIVISAILWVKKQKQLKVFD